LGPGGPEDGVGGWREVRSAVADQEFHVLEPLAEAEGKGAGLLHGPLAGGFALTPPMRIRRVLGEHQHGYALQQHGARVQGTGCGDPGGLGAQELPPARARAPRFSAPAARTRTGWSPAGFGRPAGRRG
jgi:hypothetical protein